MLPPWLRGFVKVLNGKVKSAQRCRSQHGGRRPTFRPTLEQFEARLVPTALSIPTNLTQAQGGVIQVPINVDNLQANAGSGIAGGLFSGDFVVFYDQNVFSIAPVPSGQQNSPDIQLGSIPSSVSGWSIASNTNVPGQINIGLSNDGNPSSVITSTAGGSLILINFTVKSTAAIGATRIDLAANTFNASPITHISDRNAADYPLSPAPQNNAQTVIVGGSPTLAVPYSYSGNDASDGTVTVTGTTSAAVHHFAVSAPGSATAGTPFSITVTAQDVNNNTVTNYIGTVQFTSSDTGLFRVLPANYNFVAGDNGVHTFAAGATLVMAGNQTVTATDTGNSSVTGTSGNINVLPGATTQLIVNGAASAVAGTSFSFTVTARDAFNNTATGYGGTVHFSSSDSNAQFVSNDVSLTSGTGTFNATLQTVGNQTLTAGNSAIATLIGTSNQISVNTGIVARFQISAANTTAAGQGLPYIVTAVDQFNNTVTTYAGTVNFSSTDTLAILPPSNTLTNGSGIFAAVFNTVGNQTLTATDSVNSSITGSATFTVTAPQVHFSVTAPSTANAGDAFNYTVTALDPNNNTITGYTGAVTFASNDLQAALPPNATLTAGTGTFTATLRTAGSRTITATDAATPSITGTSGPITVSAGAATDLRVTAPPGAVVGAPFNFTVTALDDFNNTATGYAGTVEFSSSDNAVALPTSTALINGVGTFSATLNTTGSQTLGARDSANDSITGTSGPITVSAPATRFFIATPATATAGQAFTYTVLAIDANNQTATGYTGTVHFTSSDSQATLPADATLTNGIGAFSATLRTGGNQTLSATDTAASSLTGTSDNILVEVLPATNFLISAPSVVVSGVSFAFTVTARDQFNNTVTNYAGTVQFTSNDGAVTLPGNATLTNGVGTFTATFKTTGNRTLTATDTQTSTLTGSTNLTVNAALAISNLTNPRWTRGRSFPDTLTVTGGIGPYTITAQSGLPTGLTAVLSGSTVSFTGTPTAAGAFPNGSITVQDSTNTPIVKALNITITEPPTLGALSQTQWTVNHPGFSSVAAVTAGTNPFVLTSAVTGLPPGLTAALSTGGTLTISGTPTTVGTFNFNASVTDVAGAVATQSYTVTINPAPTITPTALPASRVGTAYTQAVTAEGGTGDKSVSYAVTGTLPAGLSIAPASPAPNTFTIAGTPTGTGTASFTVTATDAVGASTTTTLILTGHNRFGTARPRWGRV